MESCTRNELHEKLASRRAEEAAWRRFQATEWLQNIVGPLGMCSNPSEKEFISLLRNGLILCNAINKVHPGAVPKVVENPSPLQSFSRESQPLPAYQYFENVRNFLVALEELKLPGFEASDLERDTLEAASVAKVVDCILALKSYHECKQMNGRNGIFKPVRSPLVMHSANWSNSRPASSSYCRQLDMSQESEKQLSSENVEAKISEEILIQMLARNVLDAKENINDNLLMSFRAGNMDPMKVLGRILSSCMDISKIPELKAMCGETFKENSRLPAHSLPPQDLSEHGAYKSYKPERVKENGNRQHLLGMQEKELQDLKTLLTETKNEFSDMQSQLERDMRELTIQVQEMSTAALGYHRVLKENRNLYNMVQDLKGNIRVYCRIRPAFSAEIRNVIDFIGEDGSLVISDPLKPQKDGRKMFQFNRIFGPASSQEEVFLDIQPLIRSVMDGYNVCIFAYGQTGSGKTYTMSGPAGGLSKDMGINYLALNDLFHIANTRTDVVTYDIQVQMVEIYNEQVRDLLADDPSANKLEIRSCTGDSGMSLPDATLHSVKSTADVLNLMKLGEVNRVVCSTAINNRSSRSHSILTVHVHGKDVSGNMLRSCLHLVDLAGSERVDKSEVTGDSLKEAQYINKSLSCLGDVIAALAQRNSYIPYRNSKLTLLLQDSLGGHAKTLMFAHVSPEGDSFGETITTLKFAQRVATLELGAARANKESSEIMLLKEQVENLKKALANKEAMRERTPVRVRRLSLENGSSKETQNAQISRVKEPRSPCEKPKTMIDRTPPRHRRLNIEDGSNVKSEKKMNPEDRKGLKTPCTTTRTRRLSLEGPRSVKKENFQPNLADNKSKMLHFDTVVTTQKYGLLQDPEALMKPCGNYANGKTMEVYHINAPVSPTSLSYLKRVAKADNRSRIPTLQLMTPDPQVLTRNEQNELIHPTNTRIANALDNSNGKESQIRKSLRTIGKLINGSEKRNPVKEPRSPIKGTNKNNDMTTPVTANARTVRRQSLTGVTSGSDRSRRSSLGWNPIETDDSGRNAKTPPPVHYSSAKAIKRWQ